MKRAGFGIIMGLILAMLCGCGQRQSVSAEKETDRIVIWTWDDTFNVKAAKLAAKEYVASIIGNEYIIPVLGVWNNPEQIPKT